MGWHDVGGSVGLPVKAPFPMFSEFESLDPVCGVFAHDLPFGTCKRVENKIVNVYNMAQVSSGCQSLQGLTFPCR